ncbi:hypothetical protein CAOG_04379 [Capsaspora owczarzaki ATCC 30864]|uniref:hypothetical protein n=1 Tax=Capsaspora owczarzaki (strain ATCC 30864) TaxID=595528 RepID=UPI0003521898|nr:hypothetical protein CAOG_04379 [Capsaspora owczarzaki ATCC 30864]|eukprot:XP_004348207.2 hypothetical protein CAOG_04379 [Capsaspora owczarzaki ATCC 30864]
MSRIAWNTAVIDAIAALKEKLELLEASRQAPARILASLGQLKLAPCTLESALARPGLFDRGYEAGVYLAPESYARQQLQQQPPLGRSEAMYTPTLVERNTRANAGAAQPSAMPRGVISPIGGDQPAQLGQRAYQHAYGAAGPTPRTTPDVPRIQQQQPQQQPQQQAQQQQQPQQQHIPVAPPVQNPQNGAAGSTRPIAMPAQEQAATNYPQVLEQLAEESRKVQRLERDVALLQQTQERYQLQFQQMQQQQQQQLQQQQQQLQQQQHSPPQNAQQQQLPTAPGASLSHGVIPQPADETDQTSVLSSDELRTAHDNVLRTLLSARNLERAAEGRLAAGPTHKSPQVPAMASFDTPLHPSDLDGVIAAMEAECGQLQFEYSDMSEVLEKERAIGKVLSALTISHELQRVGAALHRKAEMLAQLRRARKKARKEMMGADVSSISSSSSYSSSSSSASSAFL